VLTHTFYSTEFLTQRNTRELIITMKILIFILTVFSLLILKGLCQYGDPIVGGAGQFTFECLQIEDGVISSPGEENYEVVAGKPFSYRCDITVDNRNCEHNPQSSGCQGVEIVWAIPSTLAQIEQEKGFFSILNTRWLSSF
jgi:hypothetical protein